MGRPRESITAFSEWLDLHGGADLVARQLKVSASHVRHLANGSRSPSRTLAIKIEKVSAGAVPVKRWA